MKYLCIFLFFIAIKSLSIHAQELKPRRNIRIMFYNVENLFDTIDNVFTSDEEFLPGSARRWNSYKYWRKIRQIYQVIATIGENDPPEIIGLCEVEGQQPLYDLIYNTPLMKFPYKIVHYNSPDKRGIDVALLLRSDVCSVLSSKPLGVSFKEGDNKRTRDILYTKLLIFSDTLHVFVNHWPSRRGGQKASEKYRLQASGALIHRVDSLTMRNINTNIVAMGDFNDEPANLSLQQLKKTGLTNLSEKLSETCKYGSYKYKNNWHIFDQMLVSEGLLKSPGLSVVPQSLIILDNWFLTETDETYGGRKLRRTFLGPRYIGGCSDHLPIYLDFQYCGSD